MIDQDRDQIRRNYQLCRLGFGFIAAALVLATFSSLVSIVGMFNRHLMIWLSDKPWYQYLDTPIVWFSLVGATLLWGRWNQSSWQRRSGLLLAMSVVDVVLWFLSRGESFGLNGHGIGHRWLRDHVGEALGWAEFALLSSLTSGYLVHLGVEQASDSDKSTRSLAATGAVIWLLLFCQCTNWAAWPLQPRRIHMLEGFLLYHGFQLIWAVTVIQVTAMVVSAVQHSTWVIEEMNREDLADDLFRASNDSMRDDASYATSAQRPF